MTNIKIQKRGGRRYTPKKTHAWNQSDPFKKVARSPMMDVSDCRSFTHREYRRESRARRADAILFRSI